MGDVRRTRGCSVSQLHPASSAVLLPMGSSDVPDLQWMGWINPISGSKGMQAKQSENLYCLKGNSLI